jgi:hypothetical protein
VRREIQRETHLYLPDCRRLFLRGAGANAVKKGANDAPYDGNSIGAFTGDAAREITGHFALAVYPYFIGVHAASGAFYAITQLDNIADLLSANHISSTRRADIPF